MVVIVPETTLTAPQYQEFYQLAMTHQLVREMPNLLAADLRPVLRYQAYTQTDSERMYWAQVRHYNRARGMGNYTVKVRRV